MAEQPQKDVSNKLSAKLQKRPSASEAGHGAESTLAPTLQATAKKLETEQKKDIVDQNLKRRGSATEHGINTTVASSIQPAAKSLESKMRRDSLKHTLNSRPEIQELIDSGVLKPYSQRLAKSLQVDAARLEERLAGQVPKQYLQDIGILDPYSKHVDSSHVDIEQASSLLLRALVYRPTASSVQQQVSGTQFGYSNVSSSLQETAKKLDVEQKKDKLSSALATRPSPRGVMEKQVGGMGYTANPNVSANLQQTIKDLGREMIKDVIRDSLLLRAQRDKDEEEKSSSPQPSRTRRRRASSFDAEQLAPSLQAIANKLAMEQKKQTLKEQLQAKPQAQELIDRGILKPYAGSLAARLQLEADTLEQQLAVRVSADYLKEIGILDPYSRHVDTSSIQTSGNEVEEKANLILKSLIAARKRRESAGDKEIAASLASTAKQLETQQTKDALKQKLNERATTSTAEIEAKTHIDSTVAPSLQATKKKLETAQKADAISKTLSTRSSAEEAGVDVKISPAIQSIAKQLASKLRRNSLSAKVSARPEAQDLIDHGILKPYSQTLAKSLQIDAYELEQALAHQVPKSYLQEIGILDPYSKHVDSSHVDMEQASSLLLRRLVYRPNANDQSVNEQATAFGFDHEIAASLQQTAHHLEVQQKKDKLSSALEQRPTPRGVMQKQVTEMGYDSKVAANLQQTIKDLGRAMLKDYLENELRERPSAQDIGVDVKTAPKIQGAMHELQKAQKRDSISRGLKDPARPNANEIGVDTQLARGLQGIAKNLEREMKSDKMAHTLQATGLIKKQNTRSVLFAIDQLIEFVDQYQL